MQQQCFDASSIDPLYIYICIIYGYICIVCVIFRWFVGSLKSKTKPKLNTIYTRLHWERSQLTHVKILPHKDETIRIRTKRCTRSHLLNVLNVLCCVCLFSTSPTSRTRWWSAGRVAAWLLDCLLTRSYRCWCSWLPRHMLMVYSHGWVTRFTTKEHGPKNRRTKYVSSHRHSHCTSIPPKLTRSLPSLDL